MSNKTIWCMATSAEDEPIPLFVGRENGSVEKYISISDADLGRPSLVMRGHTRAVTGMSAVSADELFTCSLDGTVKQWNAEIEYEGRRIVRSVDTKTPLRCLFMNDGRVYVGGENGSLIVVDGDRKSIFNGHKEAVTAIAVTMEGYVVTGGADHQIRVWDTSLGKTIRLLIGHQNVVKCLVVVEDDEDDEARGAILSFSRDRTMKVWRIPDPQDVQGEQDSLLDEEKKSFMVSFQEPEKGGDESAANSPSPPMDSEKSEEGKPMDENAAAAATAAAAMQAANAGENGAGAAAEEDEEVDEENQQRRLSTPPIKSALKSKEKQLIRRDEALSTIELPEAPHCSFQEEESSIVYIGTAGGYVYGIQAKSIANTVLKFVAKNKAMVRKDVRETKQTVKKSIAVYKRECRKLVKAEEKKHLRVARRNNKEKKKKEREERKKAREAKAAERAAKRAAQRDEEDDEEDEGEFDEGEFEEDDDDEENPEEEEEEEEEEEDRLRILSEEQRETLKKFVEEREKERDEKIRKLEDAFAAHLAKIEPLAKSTYDRPRAEFHRLHWTTYTKAGENGTLALTSVNGKVYVAQADRVIPTTVTRGVTVLQ